MSLKVIIPLWLYSQRISKEDQWNSRKANHLIFRGVHCTCLQCYILCSSQWCKKCKDFETSERCLQVKKIKVPWTNIEWVTITWKYKIQDLWRRKISFWNSETHEHYQKLFQTVFQLWESISRRAKTSPPAEIHLQGKVTPSFIVLTQIIQHGKKKPM